MRRHRILSPLLLTLCVPWAAVSCGSDGGDLGGPRGHVMSVEVSPPQARAPVGGTLNYTATAYDASGAPVTGGVRYIWSSARPGVATVDPGTGSARGVSNGSAVIRVNAIDDRGSAQGEGVLQVEEIADVLVNPTSATVRVGARTRLRARAYYADGGAAAGVPFLWRSRSTEIATVTEAQGSGTEVLGMSPGTATIVANAVPEGRLGRGGIVMITVLGGP